MSPLYCLPLASTWYPLKSPVYISHIPLHVVSPPPFQPGVSFYILPALLNCILPVAFMSFYCCLPLFNACCPSVSTRTAVYSRFLPPTASSLLSLFVSCLLFCSVPSRVSPVCFLISVCYLSLPLKCRFPLSNMLSSPIYCLLSPPVFCLLSAVHACLIYLVSTTDFLLLFSLLFSVISHPCFVSSRLLPDLIVSCCLLLSPPIFLNLDFLDSCFLCWTGFLYHLFFLSLSSCSFIFPFSAFGLFPRVPLYLFPHYYY